MGHRNRKQLVVDLDSLAEFMETYVSADGSCRLAGGRTRERGAGSCGCGTSRPQIEKADVSQYFYRRTDIRFFPNHSTQESHTSPTL